LKQVNYIRVKNKLEKLNEIEIHFLLLLIFRQISALNVIYEDIKQNNRGDSEHEKNKKAGATRQKKHNEGANLID
jgi:hypothetical protein